VSRQPLITRPTTLHMHIPEGIRARLDLYLHSDLEGRVPKGAYQAFFSERITEFFNQEEFVLPNGEKVRGSADAIALINALLEE